MEDNEIRIVLNAVIEMIYLHVKINPKCSVNDVINMLNDVLNSMDNKGNV